VVQGQELPLQGLSLFPTQVEPGAPKVDQGREVLRQEVGFRLPAKLQKALLPQVREAESLLPDAKPD